MCFTWAAGLQELNLQKLFAGTLTPIVSNPDEAVMSEEVRGAQGSVQRGGICNMTNVDLCPPTQMRDVVRSVARAFPTAIISGRGREKVEAFVQLKELFYAGSHGMDIAGPRVSAVHCAGH